MKAITYPALGEVKISSIPDPQPAAGEIAIRVRASGLCHTDIDILHGRYGNSDFPLVPGHEYSGEIVALGEGVEGFSVSDRVVVDPNFHCGHCRSCKKGLFNMCENLGAYGVTRNGGFAEISVVRQENVFPLGNLSFELGALAEPIGCVLNGLNSVNTETAENGLVFGAGPIGMLMALSMRARGVKNISMVDLEEGRLQLAQSFGMTPVHSGSAELEKLHRDVDLVVDATGVPAVAEGLIDYAADGGNILFFGVCKPDAKIAISPYEIFRRQIRIAGAHSLNHNIPAALDVIHHAGDEMNRLISHRLPLAEIPKFLSGRAGKNCLKVQAVF